MFEDGQSRRGRGADEESGFGVSGMKCCCEFQSNPHLSDTDCMKPNALGTDPGHGLLPDEAEALCGLGSVSTPPSDAQEVCRQEEQQDRNEEEVVENKGDPLHGSAGVGDEG